MRLRFLSLFLVIVTALLSAIALEGRAAGPAVRQDPQVLSFMERALPWYPSSSLTMIGDEGHITPSGRYRVVTVDRSCPNEFLSGHRTVLIDELTTVAWVGSLAALPVDPKGIGGDELKQMIEGFLPKAMEASTRLRVSVEWDSSYTHGAAVIPFVLKVSTGYGEYRRPAAVTADGRNVVLGFPLPLDQDPVAVRRDRLAKSDAVIWDHGDGAVQMVEFSDFECPGCKAKWSLIKKALETYGGSIKHGMVSYPLTTIHPWAFRAASAGWCVGSQDPALLLPIKELFYSLQGEMTVSEVTTTSRDFVAGNGLDEDGFNGCYLKPESIDAVHRQLGLGASLGVMATPTYFVNGWQVQMPEESWFFPMLERLIGGKEPF